MRKKQYSSIIKIENWCDKISSQKDDMDDGDLDDDMQEPPLQLAIKTK